ncbi:hypothetical protein CDL15_Pgr007829 [Punica granatum]|uniref:Uncharacterized protein n=1 Tax=Punica granatum TaxID=22663 RepID=A0A218XBA8_PUNGR|nr:hypothetical protein CDL15_Pgr007829 [Punica granatum]PKI43444.1 hypothetical protein CRG98_036201 [Punica granatum]
MGRYKDFHLQISTTSIALGADDESATSSDRDRHLLFGQDATRDDLVLKPFVAELSEGNGGIKEDEDKILMEKFIGSELRSDTMMELLRRNHTSYRKLVGFLNGSTLLEVTVTSIEKRVY